MTYTFKLSRRLAVSRPAAVLVMLAATTACYDTTAPNTTESRTFTAPALRVLPASVTAEVNQSIQFRAVHPDVRGRDRFTTRSSAPVVETVWTASGGTVTAAGTFSATTPGVFKVIGRGKGSHKSDTATVVVVPTDSVARVVLTPATVSLDTGATQIFTATAYHADGSTATIGLTWSATGGTIQLVTAGSEYLPGPSPGTFRVVAANTSGTVADTSVVTVTAPTVLQPPVDTLSPPPPPAGNGIPFGPFGLWSSATSLEPYQGPFTTSQNYTDPGTIVTQIAAARTMKQRLVLAMTGGPHSNYLTNGAFDLSKWKARMDRFNTSAIRNAVAQGVADGTIVGNSLMDEPEFTDWGGVVTKPMLDQMATYAKNYFPTLPMGVNHGPSGYYQWRPTERYKVVDYVVNQYAWWVTKGDLAQWRDKVLAQAALDGITPAFSLNLLNGGVQDTDGTWDCSGTGGLGTRAPNCRMTATQLRSWGTTLAASACALLMWKYDDAFVTRTDNQQAFGDVATRAASLPSTSCRRS